MSDILVNAGLGKALLSLCREKNIRLATAESCTGGLVAATLTAIPGASDVFEGGFVTYSNEAKREFLGVSPQLLERYGAVSEEVACALAEGALEKSGADIAASVTGIAGPSGGSSEKPVGLVYIAVAAKDRVTNCEYAVFDGNRDEIRSLTVKKSLDMLMETVNIY